MQFTVTAALNTADATSLLSLYTRNETLSEARIYVPPTVVYTLSNGQIKSYSSSASASGSSVTFTLTEQRFTVISGSSNSATDC